MSARDVFHSGEIAVQVRAGERTIAERRASLVLERLNESMRTFLARQHLIAVGGVAPDDSLWATLWCESVGFLHADADGEILEIRRRLDVSIPDPLRRFVRPNAFLGTLVIDLETRRRLRINGVVDRTNDACIALRVAEAFGNCQKYIQKRVRDDRTTSDVNVRVERGDVLDEHRCRFIARADTCFVASVHGDRGVDTSHRGGSRGFARVRNDRTLRIPDYAGNSMFQTLGNFEADARAGIAFVDFEEGRVLSMSGHAFADFGDEDCTQPTGGTDRYWWFIVDRWVEFPLTLAGTWMLVEPSPFNPR